MPHLVWELVPPNSVSTDQPQIDKAQDVVVAEELVAERNILFGEGVNNFERAAVLIVLFGREEQRKFYA